MLVERNPERRFIIPGGKTSIWVDLDRAVQDPDLSRLIATLLWKLVPKERADFIATAIPAVGPLGITPIAAYLSIAHAKPLVIWSENRIGEAKLSSTPPDDKTGIILHDIVSRGQIVARVAHDIETKSNASCRTAVAVVDRDEGAAQFLKERGIELISVFTLTQIVTEEHELG